MPETNASSCSRLSNVLKLSRYIREYWGYMAAYIAIGTIYRLLPIATSLALSYMTGHLLDASLEINFMAGFAVLLGLVMLRALGRYADTLISHDITYRILATLRIKLYKKIEEISPAFLQGKRSGNLAAVVMEDVNVLEWFYAHTLGTVIMAVLILLTAFVFLWILHPILTLCVMPFIALLICVHAVTRRKADTLGIEVRNKLGTLSAELVDGVQGTKDILALNWQDIYRKKIAHARNDYEEARIRDGRHRGIQTSLCKGIIALSSITVLCVAALLLRDGQIAPTWYLAAVAVSGAIFVPVNEVLTMSAQFGVIFAAAGRVFNILNAPVPVQDHGTHILRREQAQNIQFKDVSFTYPGEREPALQHVSFNVRSGETVALAGASGAGKSTIVNLLERFYDFDDGDILVGGLSIREYTMESLRAQIAIVPQDVYLFNVSLLENLRLAKPQATDAEVRCAAKMALADDFIQDLPDGYETVAGERGLRFSGGQRQRIAIARALLENAGILILDEASSSLDTENETLLNQALAAAKHQRTTLVIAHRISTLRSADRIIFLHEGQILGDGTFDALMENCIQFREVVGSQEGEAK